MKAVLYENGVVVKKVSHLDVVFRILILFHIPILFFSFFPPFSPSCSFFPPCSVSLSDLQTLTHTSVLSRSRLSHLKHRNESRRTHQQTMLSFFLVPIESSLENVMTLCNVRQTLQLAAIHYNALHHTTTHTGGGEGSFRAN